MYEQLETSPDIEFDFHLTRKLGWRSVAEMRRGMPAHEWRMWNVFLAREAQKREIAGG